MYNCFNENNDITLWCEGKDKVVGGGGGGGLTSGLCGARPPDFTSKTALFDTVCVRERYRVYDCVFVCTCTYMYKYTVCVTSYIVVMCMYMYICTKRIRYTSPKLLCTPDPTT